MPDIITLCHNTRRHTTPSHQRASAPALPQVGKNFVLYINVPKNTTWDAYIVVAKVSAVNTHTHLPPPHTLSPSLKHSAHLLLSHLTSAFPKLLNILPSFTFPLIQPN